MSLHSPSHAGDQAGATLAAFVAAAELPHLSQQLQRLQRTPQVLQAGGPEQAAQWCAAHGAPATLLVDISGHAYPQQALADLASLCGPTTHIVLTGERQDVDLYRKLLQGGAFDYLLKPLDMHLLADTLARAAEGLPLNLAGQSRSGRTVAIVGAAGGAGVSTVVAALGQRLAGACQTPTVLVDLDRSKGDLPLLLGMEADSGLSAMLALPEIDARLLQRTLRGAELADSAPPRLQLLAQRPEAPTPVDPERVLQLGAALSQLFSVALWDLPAHRPDGAREVLEHADIRIILTELNLQHARHVHRLLADIGDESGGQQLLLVHNNVRPAQRSAISLAQFEEFVGRKIDLQLPCAGNQLIDSLVDGALEVPAGSPFSSALAVLADRILGRRSAVAAPSLLARLLALGGQRTLVNARSEPA
ncbi:MAG: hypothetical protein ABW202_24405 [Duganella sp.]